MTSEDGLQLLDVLALFCDADRSWGPGGGLLRGEIDRNRAPGVPEGDGALVGTCVTRVGHERLLGGLAPATGEGVCQQLRVRADRRVGPDHDGGFRTLVLLKNLSPGGLCLGDVPSSWRVDQELQLRLTLENELFELWGQVRWRLQTTVGIALSTGPRQAANEETVRRMLGRLLSGGRACRSDRS